MQIPKGKLDKFFELNMKLWKNINDEAHGLENAKLLHDRLAMSVLNFDETGRIGRITGVSLARLEADVAKVRIKNINFEVTV